MLDKFNLAEWLTAGGALSAAIVAALGVRRQWESDDPVLEAKGEQLENGLIAVRLNIMRRLDRTIVIHAARIKKPRTAKLRLATYYRDPSPGYGGESKLKFDLPFQDKQIRLHREVMPVRESHGTLHQSLDVYLQPDKKALAAFSISFLVSIKSRPNRKRWITVSSTVSASMRPQTARTVS